MKVINCNFYSNINCSSNIKFNAKFKTDNPAKAFLKDFNENDGQKALSSILQGKGAEKLGEGYSKIVFNFLKDYVVAILKNNKIDLENQKIVPCSIPYAKYNFAQPIAQTQNGNILFLEKVSGSSFNTGVPLQPQNEWVENFLKKLNICAGFPDESFVDLAQQIKYLSDNHCKVDHVNPDNILVDVKNKRFNLIDIDEKYQELFKYYGKSYNSVYDMVFLLTGGLGHTYYLDVLQPEQREDVVNVTKMIINKSTNAAKKVGLELGNDNMVFLCRVLRRMNTDMSKNLREAHIRFFNLYDNEIKK